MWKMFQIRDTDGNRITWKEGIKSLPMSMLGLGVVFLFIYLLNIGISNSQTILGVILLIIFWLWDSNILAIAGIIIGVYIFMHIFSSMIAEKIKQ